jgi:hypothetical protein
VHLTLDLAGQAKFGPDVEWVDAIDYGVDPLRAPSFYAVRTYWPGLPEGALQPGYAGVRPKIARPWRLNHRFPPPERKRTRRCGVDQPVRNRVAGADGEPGDCGLAGAPRLTLLRSDAYGDSLVHYLDVTARFVIRGAEARPDATKGGLLQPNAQSRSFLRALESTHNSRYRRPHSPPPKPKSAIRVQAHAACRHRPARSR